ncbi:MAG: toxin-antitoxin system, antitoxin component, PHD domain protein [Oscillospiraceae bacterium]|jgi:hypothetical protein|nr:toxin-antitoxin system, antitoxin component, PHD domain protein [Oscillospiraceae bacterium]
MPRIQSNTDEMLSGKLELYHLLDEGRSAAKAERKRPYADVFNDIEQDIADGDLARKNTL